MSQGVLNRELPDENNQFPTINNHGIMTAVNNIAPIPVDSNLSNRLAKLRLQKLEVNNTLENSLARPPASRQTVVIESTPVLISQTKNVPLSPNITVLNTEKAPSISVNVIEPAQAELKQIKNSPTFLQNTTKILASFQTNLLRLVSKTTNKLLTEKSEINPNQPISHFEKAVNKDRAA